MAEMFRAADLLRGVDLRAYAQKVHGYELCVGDSGQGIAVLESARLADRVAIAQTPMGWVYAHVPDYAPRGPNEPSERAMARLRDCIGRSPSKGGVVEFAERVEALARAAERERAAPRAPERGTLVMGRPAAAPDLNQCRTDWRGFIPGPPTRGVGGPER